ncbi:winged helix-turn-helix transcriptional regulator [Roseobacter sp. MH60115]|uniref:winged helix-turn-helix transcriptional regulator n=1 Tax=Roseobacter sp. MH60115 TaxID=2785324 RepID=UPI0018A2A088|nr:helix-turn-helix domain-containing protein [Roseobacter sp. MH60115]
MAKTRSYKLLCPIARALDAIGDRWTLLILRDLLAGPARFTDLQTGLSGIAANLLTDRLAKLTSDGLVTKSDGQHGAALYALTDSGKRTRNILFELALFGGGMPHPKAQVKPGNLRTVATTLGAAAARVTLLTDDFVAELRVDGEQITMRVEDGAPTVLYAAAEEPDVVFETTYEALLQASEGEISLQDFVADHSRMQTYTHDKDQSFMMVMQQIMNEFGA